MSTNLKLLLLSIGYVALGSAPMLAGKLALDLYGLAGYAALSVVVLIPTFFMVRHADRFTFFSEKRLNGPCNSSHYLLYKENVGKKEHRDAQAG